jgi:sugar lactone lactonase YvrE
LYLECLEDRIVPSSLSVADVTAREGPTSTGILDPSGAASVGINGIRDMTFDNGPTDAHYGDLFVTGYLSNSVARFDWASQTYQPFVSPGSGGLQQPRGIAFGPDGNLYVTEQAKDVTQQSQDMVFRFNGSTGAPLPAPGQSGAVFIPAGSGGLSKACDLAFGADGNLYVISGNTNQVLEYQGPAGSSPGAFMKVFVSITNGSGPNNLAFGPDGNLYVDLADGAIPGYTPPSPGSYGSINRYDGTTGAPIGNGVFVTYASGGLANPRQFVFDSQGTNLYVASSPNATGGPMGQVLHYQGPNGQNPGAFVEEYITGGQAGVSIPIGLASDAAGNLYLSDRDTANVTRFAPSSQASFTVTLDSPSASPVSVNYATADGTAVAGTDYTQTSGTLVFPAGVTSETISVPIITVATGGPTKTFTMNLSGASGATINRAQGTGSILNRQTKFFVVDSGSVVKTYEYGSGGTSEEITAPYYTNDTAPRGVAANAAGTTEWVVDANKNVYVYNNHGVLQGSWSAGGLSSSAQLTGIATNGTDIWLVDSYTGKVYKFTGAASRLSGSQNAASSFSLTSGKNGDPNPQDIVTDGTSFWVVDGTKLKVFKYTLSGSLLGSWSIDPANTHPTGITIDPINVSDIWIVDNGTDKVYQYIGAASRTSGSQSAGATFALAPGNTDPVGIADPPTADMLLTPAAPPLAQHQQSVTAVAPSLTNRDAAFAQLLGESLQNSGALPTGRAITTFLDHPIPVTDLLWTTAGAFGGPNPLDTLALLAPVSSPSAHSDGSAMGLQKGTLAGEDRAASAAVADFVSAEMANEAAEE